MCLADGLPLAQRFFPRAFLHARSHPAARPAGARRWRAPALLAGLRRVPTTFVQKYTPRAQLQALGCPRAGLRARETGGGGRPARFCQE